MNPPNQKQLHKAAKRKVTEITYPREKPIPVGMYLPIDDKDGANYRPIRNLFEDVGDYGDDVDGEEFSKMTEDQERDIPCSDTYFNLDNFPENRKNRLMVRPKSKSSKNNIIVTRSFFNF
jgi:hypothetical protein